MRGGGTMKRRCAALLAAGALTALVGCGGDEAPPPPGCIAALAIRSTMTPPDLFSRSDACVTRGRVEDAAHLALTAELFATFDARRVLHPTASDLAHRPESAPRDELGVAIATLRADPHRMLRVCDSMRRVGPPSYTPSYLIERIGVASPGIETREATAAELASDDAHIGLPTDFDARRAWRALVHEALACPETVL